jgi:hypothetical protein
MPEVELLATGEGDYRLHDPDTLRAWMRDRKRRELVDKTTTAADAVRRLVADGDYVFFDFSSFTRGPLVLIREIVRQRRRNLWYCAKFTLMESTLLVAAGACSKVDVGSMGLGETLSRAVERGDVTVSEWTNGKRAGLPAGTGPWRVVTSKALFGFDEPTHELTLLGVLDGLSVDHVVSEMGMKPRVAARVERLAPPSARELEILRDQIDPGRTLIGRTAKSG